MNFVAHYYIDQHLDNQLFVIGVCTPDLLPVFDRKKRVRARKVLKVIEASQNDQLIQFGKGNLRHFEADDYFHSATFFQNETKLITEMIRERYPNGEIKRDFFVAHILFELVLDRILVLANPQVLDDFYQHWDNQDLSIIKNLTQQLCGENLTGYQLFLQRFISPQIPLWF